MSNATAKKALLLATLLACGASPALAARKKQAPTLADLSTRSAPVNRAEPVVADNAQAAQSYEAFLAIDGADPALRAQALRRLGDLRLDAASALGADEQAVNTAEVASANAAIAAYRQLLHEYPRYTPQDAVLYQLARAYEISGESGTALAVLDDLVTRFPQGLHTDEAQFRRGEAFFSARRYGDAKTAYAAVVTRGAAGTFYEQALYKLAWTEFKQNDNAASSASFLQLLDRLLVADGKLRSESQLSRAEQELTADTLRALSLMFAAEAGADRCRRRWRGAVRRRTRRACTVRSVTCTSRSNATRTRPRLIARLRAGSRSIPRRLYCSSRDRCLRSSRIHCARARSKRELVELYGPRSAFWTAVGTEENRSTRQYGGAGEPARPCASSSRADAEIGHCGGPRRGHSLVPRVSRRIRRYAKRACNAALAR